MAGAMAPSVHSPLIHTNTVLTQANKTGQLMSTLLLNRRRSANDVANVTVGHVFTEANVFNVQ